MDKPIRVGLTATRMLRLIIVVILAGRTFTADAQTVTNLHSFGLSDGANPYAGLVQGSDGNFYGTTSGGGSGRCLESGDGTLFRISPSGSYTGLYVFGSSCYNGAGPRAGLVQGSDGNFYGTTYYGGSHDIGDTSGGAGTVFRITPSGSYTNLYSFAGPPSDGNSPEAGLVQGSDGNFYGTTYQGGASNNGTVFRISPNGAYTNLYSFGSQPHDGYQPQAELIQGSDGNFYGTAALNGMLGGGTVFRISPSGSYTSLYSFAGSPSDGSHPVAGLTQGSDGNFYGTTEGGGAKGYGTVFRISPSGNETNLYSFSNSPDGLAPRAGLVQGSDGNFYGTTAGGGTNTCNCGTVFRISPSGNYTSLYSFAGYPNDGAVPLGLAQGSDGNFYGTTSTGGTNRCYCGTVFKLTVPLSPPANQISEIQFFNVLDSTIVALPIPSVAGETYQLQYSDSMSPTNWLNTGGTFTSIGGPLVLIDLAEPLPPQRFYRAVITP